MYPNVSKRTISCFESAWSALDVAEVNFPIEITYDEKKFSFQVMRFGSQIPMVYPEKIKRQLDLAKLLSCVVAADFSSENYQLFQFFFPRKFSSGASAVRTRADTFSFTVNGKTLKAKARWWLWTVAGGGSKRRCLPRQHQSAGEGSSSSSSWSSSSSCTIIRTHLNTELWFRKTRHVEEIRKVQKSGWCLCVLMSLNCVNEIAYKSIWQWSDDGHSFDLFIWLVGWTQLLFWLRFLLFSGEHETLLWLLAGLWQSAGVRHRQYFRREKIPAEHGTTCKLHTLLDTGQQTVKKKAMDDVGSYYHVWKKQIVQGRWHLHLLGRKAEWVSKKIIYNSARF